MHATERKYVRTRIGLPTLDLLWRHVLDRPDNGARSRQWGQRTGPAQQYKLAWATRISYLLASSRGEEQLQFLNYAQSEHKVARDGAKEALSIENPLSDKLSHISTNPNYYERGLVEDTTTCAQRSRGDLPEFEECIDRLTESALEQMRTTGDKTALQAILTSPPPGYTNFSTEVWSPLGADRVCVSG